MVCCRKYEIFDRISKSVELWKTRAQPLQSEVTLAAIMEAKLGRSDCDRRGYQIMKVNVRLGTSKCRGYSVLFTVHTGTQLVALDMLLQVGETKWVGNGCGVGTERTSLALGLCASNLLPTGISLVTLFLIILTL